MKFRRQSRELEPMNLISLIDVMFFLLIFFMLSSSFTKETRLGVELPEATGAASAENPQAIEIVIGEQGSMSVNGQSLVANDVETLKAAIQKISEGKTDAPVMLTADAKTPHQFVVTAMDAIGQLGFSKLNITSRAPDKSTGAAH